MANGDEVQQSVFDSAVNVHDQQNYQIGPDSLRSGLMLWPTLSWACDERPSYILHSQGSCNPLVTHAEVLKRSG